MAGSGSAHLRNPGASLLRIERLEVTFPTARGRTVHAVSDVSLDVLPGETLALVGESGCGKSTIARAIVQLPRPTSGRVIFGGDDLARVSRRHLREVRPRIQLIYQDPISSLNPRRTIGRIIEEPLRIWKRDRRDRVDQMLEAVGLNPSDKDRLPHEFSGGQCQRVSIARALVLDPSMVICDEPVSSLDVSVQAQILNLLEDMKERYGLTLLFISHDLAVVKRVSDRIMVMYLGKLCEVGEPEGIFEAPAHPYTHALLSAIPKVDPDATVRAVGLTPGDLPSPLSPPSGCRFRTRCPHAQKKCAVEEPRMRPVESRGSRFVACHFPLATSVSVPNGASAVSHPPNQ